MSAPDAGKGTFGQYLGDVEGWIVDIFPNMVAEYPGVLNVSSYFTNEEKVAQMYEKAHVDNVPPGVLIVDFKKSTSDLSSAQLDGLEQLANVGEPLAGARFDGHGQENKSHALVFANIAPPQGLKERCVWLLDVAAIDAEPDWTFPYKPRDHAVTAAARAHTSADRDLPEALAVHGARPASVVAPVVAGAGGVGVPATTLAGAFLGVGCTVM